MRPQRARSPLGNVLADERRRYRAQCLVAGAVFGFCVLALVTPVGPARTRLTVVELIVVLLAGVMAMSCRRAVGPAVGYSRPVWRLFSLTGLLWAVGHALRLFEQLSGEPPQRYLADLFFVAAALTAIAALSFIPAEDREPAERRRAWLGTAIIVSAVVLFCRALVLALPPPDLGGTQAQVGTILDVAYPLLHVALATLVWIMLLRVGIQARLPLFLGTAGTIVYVWASVYWSYHSGHASTGGGYSRQVLAIGSAWCCLLFILAALAPIAGGRRRVTARVVKGRSIGFQSMVVYVPVVVSTVVVNALPRTADPVVIASGLLVLILFGLRLTVLSVDNSRLRDDLECRVEALTSRTAELRRLVLQNERIVQSVVDGVIGVDALGLVTFANPAACRLLHYSGSGLLGVSEHEIFHGDREAAAQSAADPDANGRHTSECEPLLNCCVVATAMNTGTAAASDSECFVTSDGRLFPVELAVGPILEEGQVTGAVVVFRDVSERRKIEQLKSEFVSVVSHELRTPLTSIRGSLGLMAGGAAGPLSTSGKRMVKVALDSSERLTRLINDLLDIERIEAGSIPVVLDDCTPAELVDAAVEGLRSLTSRHRVQVEIGSGSTQVRADADRIVQALTNLIGNAVKFSPTGSTIALSVRRRDDEVLEFAVTDEGRGIPADKIGRIFERFEQVNSSDSREMGGTGLGLAISRAIIRRHGGEIWATSLPPHGSTFRFTLPAVPASDLVLVSDGGDGVPTGGRNY